MILDCTKKYLADGYPELVKEWLHTVRTKLSGGKVTAVTNGKCQSRVAQWGRDAPIVQA